jgi:uncharacterized HAD superfamily protein
LTDILEQNSTKSEFNLALKLNFVKLAYMKIGIDLDDVLSLSMQEVINFHNDTYGTNLKFEDFHTYNLWEIWGGTIEEAVDKIHTFHKSSYAMNAKPLPYSQEVIARLKKNNKLFVITARMDDIKNETEEWLNKYFPNTFSKIYYTNHFSSNLSAKTTKKKVCDELDIDILIEDSLKNVLDCNTLERKSFLFDYPWNQSDELPPNVKRIHSWKEIDIK